jgi:hypothetical protein
MSFEQRKEYIPEYPLHLKLIAAIFEYLPPPNTIRGMICYLLFFYCIRMIFKLGGIMLARYIEENSTEGIRRRIEENRKVKDIEARKLLEKLNFNVK